MVRNLPKELAIHFRAPGIKLIRWGLGKLTQTAARDDSSLRQNSEDHLSNLKLEESIERELLVQTHPKSSAQVRWRFTCRGFMGTIEKACASPQLEMFSLTRVSFGII
ncbi:uncharacterized protein M6B38_310785 [Iris pallida]|uniref:Uncharacterized protein n=1 Tax=Iris pallida TaxID=29817 RepID=A0AAX6HH27_IRIPA|nr:uncharacterized protein M6B38_310785 [Iris pallida]